MARRRRFPNAPGQAAFVLDVSVAVPWVIRSLSTSYTDGVVRSLVRVTTIVPGSWLMDLAGAVRVFEQRGWYAPSQVSTNLSVLDGFAIQIDDQTNDRAWGDILTLGRTHNISACQAAYLELALRRRLPLATINTTLTAAAGAAGVTIYTP